jgi:hypothetical protein
MFGPVSLTAAAAFWGVRVSLATAFTALFTREASLIADVPITTFQGILLQSRDGMK